MGLKNLFLKPKAQHLAQRLWKSFKAEEGVFMVFV
jgi:hypothetical protein